MRFLGLSIVFLWGCITTQMGVAQESGIFVRSIPEGTSRLYRFHDGLASRLDSVFKGAPKPIHAETVDNRLIQPFFGILHNYMDKTHYVPSTKPQKVHPSCHLFAYCSLCTQTPEFIAHAVDQAAAHNRNNPQTARVFDALNDFIRFASSNIKLSGNKNYTPPQSFHQLIKNIMLSSVKPYPTLTKDLYYLHLTTLNTVELLEHLKVGAVSHQQLKTKLKTYFENDRDFVLKEMLSCAQIRTHYPVSPSTKDPSSRTPSQEAGQPTPDSSFDAEHLLEQRKKMLFDFISPEELDKSK